MKYLFTLLTLIVFTFLIGMKTNYRYRNAATLFHYTDTVFNVGQIKTLALEYQSDNGNLTTSSKTCLDSVVTFLKDHPKICLEISSHTDSRGNDKYNLKLSEQRAKSACQYLLEQIKDPERISPRGAGENQKIYSDEFISQNALTNEEKEILHQRNRRTVLTITSVNYEKK